MPEAAWRTNPSDSEAERYGLQLVTLNYRAPELILGYRDFSGKIDIWSFGLIVSQMTLGELPISAESEIELLFEILNNIGFDEIFRSFPRWSPEYPTGLEGPKGLMTKLGKVLTWEAVCLLRDALHLSCHKRLSAQQCRDRVLGWQLPGSLRSAGCFDGERGSWNLSVGVISAEVLGWLLSDPDLERCCQHAKEAIAEGSPGPSTHVEKVGRKFVKAELFYFVPGLCGCIGIFFWISC